MNPLLANLIDSFLNKVRESENIMKAHFGIDAPWLFRQHGISRMGQFGTFSYAFHGIGCRFSFKKITVDYDYGDGGRIDGFDLWRLSLYGKQLKEFETYIKSDALKEDFEQGIASGKLVKSGGKSDNLYYCSDSINNALQNTR